MVGLTHCLWYGVARLKESTDTSSVLSLYFLISDLAILGLPLPTLWILMNDSVQMIWLWYNTCPLFVPFYPWLFFFLFFPPMCLCMQRFCVSDELRVPAHVCISPFCKSASGRHGIWSVFVLFFFFFVERMKPRPSLFADGVHPLNRCIDGEVREGSSVYCHYSSVLTPSSHWPDGKKMLRFWFVAKQMSGCLMDNLVRDRVSLLFVSY